MAIGYKGPFPELGSRAEGFVDNGFIGSSEAVGAGHENYDGRDAIDNHNFPNEESGEGQDDVCDSEGSGLFPDQA